MIAASAVFAVVITISVVTILLRALPFLAGERLSSNEYLRFLGEKMPTGVMLLLVAYTLKDLDLTTYPYGLPPFGALLVAGSLYWATRNSLLSIGLGLAGYMVTVNLIV